MSHRAPSASRGYRFSCLGERSLGFSTTSTSPSRTRAVARWDDEAFIGAGCLGLEAAVFRWGGRTGLVACVFVGKTYSEAGHCRGGKSALARIGIPPVPSWHAGDTIRDE